MAAKLTYAKAIIWRWIGIVLPGDQAQMPLLSGKASVDLNEEVVSHKVVDKYSV